MLDNSTDPFVHASQIAKERGIDRSTVQRWAQRGIFPKPIVFSRKQQVWRKSVVDAWFAEKEAEAQG